MRRILLLAAIVALAGVSAFGYAAYTREVEYRRLVDRGERALGAADLGQAVEAFSGAIALRPEAMLGWYKRGETYRRRGDLESALRDLRQATTLDPGAVRPLELMGDVLFALERYPRATERYQAVVALDDRSARVFYKLGLSRFREGQLEGAERALRQAIRLQERLPEGQYLLGLCLVQGKREAEALAPLRRAVALAPTMVPARESLVDLYRQLGRRGDEVKELEALVALEPRRPERVVALALAYDRQGRRDLAVQTLGRATRQFDASPLPYAALGRVWLEADREQPDSVLVDKALEALTRAVARGGASEAQTLLGRAWLRKGDLRRAIASLEQATTTLPVDPDAYALLGDAAERAGRLAVARDALVHAAALSGDADARSATRRAWKIGVLSARLDDPRAAEHWLERAAASVPDDPQLIVQVAEAQWRAGLAGDAQATIGRGLTRLPQDPRLLEAQRRFR
jgi:tetratricopeptide (TPR) repeat protein